MNKYFTLAFLFIFSFLIIFHPATAHAYDVSISGLAQFKNQVTSALAILAKKAPQEYQMIKKYIGRIEENERSGMLAYEEPPVYQLSLQTAFYSLTWCAGTIAHDAYHSKLYHDYKEEHGEPVPYQQWAGFEAEIECIAYQIATLKKISAPENEIEYCISLDGTHGDVNKDGKIGIEDYNLRSW